MTKSIDSDSGRATAEEALQGADALDQMDPRSENRMGRLYAWAWRFLLIGCVLVLLSPPTQARPAAHAPDCVAGLSAR